MVRWNLVMMAALAACSNDISVADISSEPIAKIVVPVDGASFDPLEPVTFCAQIDGGDDTVSLASSADGILATKETLGPCAGGNAGIDVMLSDAPHTLEIVVTDFRGRQARDEVQIVPTPNGGPSCSVELPLPGAVVEDGESVRFEGTVTDPDGDPIAVTLVSDRDGTLFQGSPDAAGGVDRVLEGLSIGAHTLALSASDPRGASALCVASIEVVECVDVDGDGYSTCEGDCDDTDDAVHPGAVELPNGIDDDCDGITDEDTDLYDDDGDGFSELAGDCDDTDASVNPDATDIPDDGIDQDCSGTDTVTCFEDADLDGHGSMVTVLEPDGDCYDPGVSELDDDCDDTDPAVYPGAPEVLSDGIDQDCDGSDTAGCYEDADNDGYGNDYVVLASPDGDCDDPFETALPGDCDDTDAATFPGAVDQPADGIDQDCDGDDATTCYEDIDDDGVGSTVELTAPDGDCQAIGASSLDTDCDDTDPYSYPGAPETPDDGIDQDCNGVDSVSCFEDADFDGFGGQVVVVGPDGDCDDPGESAVDTDCDDTRNTVFPGAPEVPNDGVDQDCDNEDTVSCFQDADQDGYGEGVVVLASDGSCDLADGESTLSSDCDDLDATVFPGAAEVPDDTVDQDCNGFDSVTCFADGDGDDFGAGPALANPLGACNPLLGESEVDTDCDDTDDTIYPGAPEVLDDGIDQDCDAVDLQGCFEDLDGDGDGSSVVIPAPDGDCDDPGEAVTQTDCDDADPTRYAGAVDTPDDGIDQDCSGTDTVSCYLDGDFDGFGGAVVVLADDGDCTDPDESLTSSDCDDNDPDAYPGSTETADDGIDQDCNGVDAVSCFDDGDGDGFGTPAVVVGLDGDCDDLGESSTDDDCDDLDGTVFPGAPEVADDGTDQDCDGTDTATCFVDADADGFGTPFLVLAPDGSCDTADLESLVSSDCDDTDGTVYPGAPEVADDGIDQDCDNEDTVTCFVDADLDGYGSTATLIADDGDCTDPGESTTDDDCDDADPTSFPGAPETVGDGIDQDCDGSDSADCFQDLDGDGVGSSVTVTSVDADCTDPGESPTSGDCDDSDISVFAGAYDTADDGIDQDCSGTDTVTCVADLDLDGFGGPTTLLASDGDCTDPGEDTTSSDCDDADSAVFPGASEVADDTIDQDCNGVDATTCFADGDFDGFGTPATVIGLDGDCDDLGESTTSDDCDDTSGTRFPGAPEVAGDGVDQDCNGADTITCFEDEDADGYGTVALVLAADGSCDAVDQESTVSTDCLDTDPSVNPGAAEVFDDGIDQDCNGADTVSCFLDGDLDGHGIATVVAGTDGDCSDPGESTTDDDCDDADDTRYPGAPEVVGDGIDQDCDGFDSADCFQDLDGDGVGSTTTVTSADADCTDPGEAPTSGDCDDSDPTVFAGAVEVADDGIDQDCSGTDTITCFLDGDFDGFGGTGTVLASDGDCNDLGEDLTSSDCNDGDDLVNPLGIDIPSDGIDQDCNGVDAIECFNDGDFDGVGTSSTSTALDGDCDDPGESTLATDCDDTAGTVFPGAPEVADDGVDQDCNGTDTVTCYVDGDLDGVGGPATSLQPDGDCTDPGEGVDGDDCDDTNPDVYPGAPEVAGNGIDEDCDGSDTVVCYLDADNDGYGTDAGTTVDASDGDCSDVGESYSADDCDDGDAGVHPGITDLFGNGIDENCDGTDGADTDLDGYAADYSGGTDCDDTDPDINPGVAETRDGVDEDCDGLCDEGLIAAGDLVITELMINPAAVGDSFGEWFEVKNVTGVDVPLCDGWVFSDLGTNSFTVADPSVVVPAGGYAVFAVEASPLANGGVTPDYVYNSASSGGMQLGQSGDELIITFDGLLIDEFLWASNFDPTGASMQVQSGLEDAGSNDLEANWCQATTPMSGGDVGTPGAAPDCP